MVNVVEVALEKGYLHIPEGMLIEANEVNRLIQSRLQYFVQEVKENRWRFSAFSEWKL